MNSLVLQEDAYSGWITLEPACGPGQTDSYYARVYVNTGEGGAGSILLNIHQIRELYKWLHNLDTEGVVTECPLLESSTAKPN